MHHFTLSELQIHTMSFLHVLLLAMDGFPPPQLSFLFYFLLFKRVLNKITSTPNKPNVSLVKCSSQYVISP
jgi:hypothetical protein